MKAFAVIVGMILTIVLCVGVGMGWSHFFPAEYTDSSEPDLAAFLLCFMVYIPVMLFFGSISTGIIIEPAMEERSYLALIFYSPGFYFTLLAGLIFIIGVSMDFLNSFFAVNSLSTSATPGVWGYLCCCFIPPIMLLFWLAASWAGTALGYKLRAKISGDD